MNGLFVWEGGGSSGVVIKQACAFLNNSFNNESIRTM